MLFIIAGLIVGALLLALALSAAANDRDEDDAAGLAARARRQGPESDLF